MKPDSSDIRAAAAVVRESGWLSLTAPDFRDAVLANCHWLGFDAGATISHGGDTDAGIFGLAGGTISVIPAVGASDTPTIHVFRPACWFGLNPLVGGAPRMVSMVARGPCILARLPPHTLAAVLSEQPQWWQWIALSVAESLAVASQIAADLLIQDSRRRCVAVLLRVAGCRKQGDDRCDAGVSQDELAGMANMSRQTAGTVLRELDAQGALELGYRTITITDPILLRAIVDI